MSATAFETYIDSQGIPPNYHSWAKLTTKNCSPTLDGSDHLEWYRNHNFNRLGGLTFDLVCPLDDIDNLTIY
jgi:NADH:ubiquinone oxidoreductase subunit